MTIDLFRIFPFDIKRRVLAQLKGQLRHLAGDFLKPPARQRFHFRTVQRPEIQNRIGDFIPALILHFHRNGLESKSGYCPALFRVQQDVYKRQVLARGEIRCIGATTYDEYLKFIEKDRALQRRFQPVMIEEPDLDSARRMIEEMCIRDSWCAAVT